MNKTWIIVQREFLTRVKKKTFLVTTILLPLLIFGFYAMMIYFSVKGADDYKVALVDKANIFNNSNPSSDKEIIFEFSKDDTATLNRKVEKGTIDGYLIIPENYRLLSNDTLELTSAKTVGLTTRGSIERRINRLLEEKRFLLQNIPKEKLDSLRRDAEITYRGLDGKGEQQSKAGISYAVGFISGFLIYIILFIYGTMVMRGVMEEKVNRIAEVIVSSVKPFQLMMGKIIGIGAVGLVQFIIWALLIVFLQLLLPLIFPELAGQMQSQPGIGAGVQVAESKSAIAVLMENLGTINWPLILGSFVFYFLGGYLLYSSLFAAVGSAVNEDPQDAQSLVLPITMPIIFSIVIMMKAVNDPNSGLAVFGSLFPLTSPIVMMARIAHGVPEGVPLWQLLLSGVFLIIGFMGTTWVAAKIYRTGILLYGKKVTWKEMWKWAFRKS
jgi:ABC-2 type transport system permease protein